MGKLLGKVIKESRLKRDYNDQAAFAEKVGVAPATISLIENGKQIPEEKTLRKIASALDLPIDVLRALSLDFDAIELPDDPSSQREIQKSYRTLLVLLKDRYGLI